MQLRSYTKWKQALGKIAKWRTPLYLPIVFLVSLPLAFVVYQSFLDLPLHYEGVRFVFFDNYAAVLNAPGIRSVFINTIIFATGATIISNSIAMLLALLINRFDVPHKFTYELLLLSSIFLPTLTVGLSWVFMMGPVGYVTMLWQRNLGQPPWDLYTLPALILIAGINEAPYAYLFMSSSVKNMDVTLEETARITGCSIRQTLWHITLPMMRAPILFSTSLVFAMMMGHLSLPLVLVAPKNVHVISTYIVALSGSMPPQYGQMGAISVYTLLLTVLLVFLQRKFLGKETRLVTITGRGYQPKPIKLGPLKYLVVTLITIYVFLSIVVPIVGVVYRSFVSAWDSSLDQLKLLTLENYRVALTSPFTANSIVNTSYMSIITASIGMTLTALIAYAIYKSKRGKTILLDYSCSLPVAVPGVVLGLGMLWSLVYTRSWIYGTIWALVLAYVIRFLPLGLRSVAPSVIQLGNELEESARIIGVGWSTRFRKIIVPLIRPGMISSWLMYLVLSFKELDSSMLLYTFHSVVMSVAIVSLLEGSEIGTGVISSLAVIQMLIIFAVVIPVRKLWKVEVYG